MTTAARRSPATRPDGGPRRTGSGARRRVASLLAGAVALGVATLVPGSAAAEPLPPTCVRDATTVTCTYGPGAATFTAPAGVGAFSVTADGAAGGRGSSTFDVGGAGGRGTELTTTVRTGPDRDYDLVVGAHGGIGDPGTGHGSGGAGGGAPRAIGGGGGGGTSVSQGATVVLVAGGGGGGAGVDEPGTPGAAQEGRPAGATVTPSAPDGGAGRSSFDPARPFRPLNSRGGGGGGGGLVGGAGGAPGEPGSAGTSTAGLPASPGSTGDGSLVISYRVSSATPPGPASRAGVDLSTTIDAPSSLGVGEAGLVTVTVTNRGTVAAERARTVVALPSTLRAVRSDATTRFDETVLAPGASATYTVEVVARRAATKQQVVASAASRVPDAALADNTGRAFVDVRPAAPTG